MPTYIVKKIIRGKLKPIEGSDDWSVKLTIIPTLQSSQDVSAKAFLHNMVLPKTTTLENLESDIDTEATNAVNTLYGQ